MPEVPNPIKIFTSPDERSPIKELHKKRFKYTSKEKIELNQIKYQDFDKISYFAYKKKENLKEQEIYRKTVPVEKRQIIELNKKIKELEKKNKSLKFEL